MATDRLLRNLMGGRGVTQVVDALCPNVETFDEFEPMLRANLWDVGLHEKQIDLVVNRSREMMTGGIPCSQAVIIASIETGKPARKKDVVWDDELKEHVAKLPL